MADNVLTVANPVMNAWTTAAIPYQGVFFEAKTINALSYVATNGNSWVNDNVMPTSEARRCTNSRSCRRSRTGST